MIGEISFTLSKEELAKLLFKKMKIQSTQISKIDTSAYGKIHVEFKQTVKLEKFIDLPVFDIRKGLRTKFYRPHHREDTLVKFSWLDLETPDKLLLHILSFFGSPKSGVQYCTIKEEEGESDLAKLLNNIPNGDRQVWMELNTSLPSYAVIDGRRVKIWDPGQRRTCARCNQDAHTCLGGANARECEEKGGIKTRTEEMWKKALQKVAYKEWAGEEIKIVNEKTGEEDNETSAEKLADENSDGIVLTNIDENTEEETIKELLRNEGNVNVEGIKIESDGRSRLVTGLPKSVTTDLIKKLDKKVFGGKMIHCKARVPSTPPKLVNSELEKDTEDPGEDKKQSGSVTLSGIPGLSSPQMSKNQKKKQKKKVKKMESPSTADDLKTSDFLLCKNLGRKASSLSMIDAAINDFAFSDDELNSEEIDTKERRISDCKTPIKLSDFTKDEVRGSNLQNKPR